MAEEGIPAGIPVRRDQTAGGDRSVGAFARTATSGLAAALWMPGCATRTSRTDYTGGGNVTAAPGSHLEPKQKQLDLSGGYKPLNILTRARLGLLMVLALPLALAATSSRAQSTSGAPPAIAGEGNVRIGDIMITKDGVTFTSSLPDHPQPSCAKQSTWFFPLRTKKEREMLVQLFAARANAAPIHVRGRGTCSSVADGELLSVIGDVDDADAD